MTEPEYIIYGRTEDNSDILNFGNVFGIVNAAHRVENLMVAYLEYFFEVVSTKKGEYKNE